MNIGCSFMRDGIAISSEDKFNMMFGAIYKKIKNQLPQDFKETIKMANLERNEEIFKSFSTWDSFIKLQQSQEQLNSSFDFKAFDRKQEYNQVIGKLLKLYIKQGIYMNYPL